MSKVYFLTQEATKEILLRVTNVCGECYNDIKEGDIIHYDMHTYRYLCNDCQDKFCATHEKECQENEYERGLF